MDASELDEAEEVFDVEFPTRDEPAEGVHPGEEAFYLPAFLVTAKPAPILSFASIAAVRGDHLDAVFVFEFWSARLEMCQWIRETLDNDGPG